MAISLHDDLLSMYTTYLDERGYQAVKVAETTTKTPDLEVTGHGSVYLNEFKSPGLRLDPVMGTYKFATTNSRLWGRSTPPSSSSRPMVRPTVCRG